MKLSEHMKANGLTLAAFAEMIGVSGAKAVHRYALGQRMPTPEVMRRIVAATDGAVQPNDFYDLDAPGDPSSPDDRAGSVSPDAGPAREVVG